MNLTFGTYRPTPQRIHSPTQFGAKVFVLEDNKDLQQGFRTALEALGHDVFIASELKDVETQFLFGNNPYDVLLIDDKISGFPDYQHYHKEHQVQDGTDAARYLAGNENVSPLQMISISTTNDTQQRIEEAVGEKIGGKFQFKKSLSDMPTQGEFFNELKEVVDSVIANLPKKPKP